MIHSYLFEAKSIQSYLFRSGKLKDVIAASERLDSLIDDNRSSLLHRVLIASNLNSDLITNEGITNTEQSICFIRSKGGAFYCYSNNKTDLATLRSSWTLTVQQLFPSLEFTDALVSAENLQEAIKLGHKQMAADRNTPIIKYPLATAITQRYQRTGQAAVPISPNAKHESKDDKILDVETDIHRQAYNKLDMSTNAALQDKFTPSKDLKGETVHYPIDLEKHFNYSASQFGSKKNKEAIKDIALIHIDGNGLGILLRSLQAVLADKTNAQYCQAFREVSSALAQATQVAAQKATLWLYKKGRYTPENSTKTYLPMRPLVLGGDDVTLLCRADLALEYSKIFCREFKIASKETLGKIHDKYVLTTEVQGAEGTKTKAIKIKPYLTASGGILYHKASHPFTHSHNLVEGLCAKAKKLTKSVDKNAGPAALAFYRLSNSVLNDIDTLTEQSQQFDVQDKHGQHEIDLSLGAYLVDEYTNNPITLANLEKCIALSNEENSAVAINKWRQMATQLSMGNKTEADRIYQRAIDLASDISKKKLLEQLQIISEKPQLDKWYWEKNLNEKLQCIISDILVIDHFSCSEETLQESS